MFDGTTVSSFSIIILSIAPRTHCARTNIIGGITTVGAPFARILPVLLLLDDDDDDDDDENPPYGSKRQRVCSIVSVRHFGLESIPRHSVQDNNTEDSDDDVAIVVVVFGQDAVTLVVGVVEDDKEEDAIFVVVEVFDRSG